MDLKPHSPVLSDADNKVEVSRYHQNLTLSLCEFRGEKAMPQRDAFLHFLGCV